MMLSTMISLYERSSMNLMSAQIGAPLADDALNGQLDEELALLLAAPCARTEDVLERLLSVNAEAVRNGAHAVGAERPSVCQLLSPSAKGHSVSMYATLPAAPPWSSGSWVETHSV